MDTLDQQFESGRYSAPAPATTSASNSTMDTIFESGRGTAPPPLPKQPSIWDKISKSPIVQSGMQGVESGLKMPVDLFKQMVQGAENDVPKNVGPTIPAQPMTQQEIVAAKQLNIHPGSALSQLSPIARMSVGLNPEETPHWPARAAGTLPTNAKGWTGAMWTQNSLPANLFKSISFAKQITNAQYSAVHAYINAENVATNATGTYSPQQVAAAKQYIQSAQQAAKNSNNPWYIIRQGAEGMVKGGIGGFARELVTDPELLLPIFGEEGGMIKAALEGAAINATTSAAQAATTPQGNTAANTIGSAAMGAGFAALGKGAFDLIPKGGDTSASTPKPDEKPVSPEAGKTAQEAKQAALDSIPKASPAEDKIPQPDGLPPNKPKSPIDATKNVDLAGGKNASGTVTHVSKEIPQHLQIDGKNVNVHDAIAVHEDLEHYLMHLGKPLSDEEIKTLRQQLGGIRLPKELYIKAKNGIPFTYPEGHYAATLKENHYVNVRYGIIPEHYQKALEPYIEKAKQAAQAEGGVPTDLDEKPNRDSDELDDLHNAQRPLESDPANDPALQELAKNTPQQKSEGVENNASGESAASIEAINRAKSEQAQGRQRVQIKPDGTIIPLHGVDSVDVRPKERDIIAQKGIGNDPNRWTLLDHGKGIHPNAARNFLAGMHDTLNDYFGSEDENSEEPTYASLNIPTKNDIADKLQHAVADGQIDHKTATLAQWVLDKNPSLAKDLGLTAGELPNGVAGRYDPIERVIHLADSNGSEPITTAVHEVLHHTERMLPENLRDGIRNEYTKSLNNAIQKETDPIVKNFLLAAKSRNADDIKASLHALIKKIGTRAYDYYQYVNPSEFWATNAADLLSRRFDAKDSLWGRVHNWMTEFVEHLKNMLGRTSHRPVLDALDYLLGRHDQAEHASFKTKDMLSEATAYPSLKKAVQDIPENAKLADEQGTVQRAKDGDPRAFETLFKAYYHRLRNYLQYRSPSGTYANSLGAATPDEIAADTFRKAYEKLHTFKGDSSFYTWLHTIANNTAKDAIAAHINHGEVSIDKPAEYDEYEGDVTNEQMQHEIADTETTPENIEIARQSAASLNSALKRLNPLQQKLIDMADFQGMPNTEIAKELGLPQSTVNVNLMRARAALENSLSDEPKFGGKQKGFASQDQLKRLARFSAVTAAAIYGYNQNKSVMDALKYGFGALGLTAIPYVEFGRSLFKMAKEPVDIRATDEVLNRQADINITQRHLYHFVQNIKALVPDGERREAITHWLEGDKSILLTPKEQQAATMIRDYFDTTGKNALQLGVVKELLDYYVTHLFSKEDAEKINKHFEGTPYSSPTSRFGKTRSIKLPLREIEEKTGIRPQTMDIAKIVDVYGSSMLSAIINKQTLDQIKARGLIKKASPATNDWAIINHPALKNLRVHPAIASEMRAVFENDNPGMFRAFVMGVNTAENRLLLSTSLMHLNNIVHLTATAVGNPFKALKIILQSVTGTGMYHGIMKNPRVGDVVDQALKAGLNIQYKPGSSMDPDVTGNFTAAQTHIANAIDNMLPIKTKLGTKTINLINRWQGVANHLIFELGATGAGLAVWDHTRALMVKNHMRALGRDLTKPEMDQISREAADFTNTHLRQVNWLHMAEMTKNKYMREALLEMASKKGINAMKLAVFAPTWDAGMIRSVGKLADFKGSDWQSFYRGKNAADFHRMAALRTALIYLTVANGINYLTVNRPIWENKDPTMIELSDGAKMQWSKALMEPFKFADSPVQETLNKSSELVRNAGEFAFNKKYLSSTYAPPITKKSGLSGAADKLMYLAKQAEPITVQQMQQYGDSGALGFLGYPKYDKTDAQKKTRTGWRY